MIFTRLPLIVLLVIITLAFLSPTTHARAKHQPQPSIHQSPSLSLSPSDRILFRDAIRYGWPDDHIPPMRYPLFFFRRLSSKLFLWFDRFKAKWSKPEPPSIQNDPTFSYATSPKQLRKHFGKMNEQWWEKSYLNLTYVLEKAKITLDGRDTVIVIPFNRNWLDIARHIECSFKLTGSYRLFFWALDRYAAEDAHSYGMNVYFDEESYGVERKLGYGSNVYQKMMNERPKFWLDVMAHGYDMIFVDADIVILKNLGTSLLAQLADARRRFKFVPDVMIQIDAFMNHSPKSNINRIMGCAGFFYLRNNKRTIVMMQRLHGFLQMYEMYKDAGRVRKQMWTWNDQTGLNYLFQQPNTLRYFPWSLADKYVPQKENSTKPDLVIMYLDQYQFMNGHLFWGYVPYARHWLIPKHERRKFRDDVESRPVLVHANGQMDKLKAFYHAGISAFKGLEEDERICLDEAVPEAFSRTYRRH